MSDPRAAVRATDATLAALPLAAGLTLQLTRWLPVQFSYRENALGIVSYATLRRYPLQQETFWLFFAAGAGALACWGLARALARGPIRPRAQAGIEALALLGLLAAMFLPGVAGALACAGAAAAAIGVARRTPAVVPDDVPQAASAGARPARGLFAFALLAALLAPLLTPPIWATAWAVAHATPDVQLVRDQFNFHAELGQHLAWADAIRRGELHGRDFFCLYGPLYDMGLAGFWSLTRRSLAAAQLYFTAGKTLSFALALVLCAALLRRRWLALALPFCVPWIELRIGLVLAGLLLLVLWLERRRRGLALAAGLAAGVALLFSQEFGLAFALSAAAAFALTREGRAAAVFAAGLALPVALVLGWFALEGALGAMLHDLVQYPRYMFAGYGKRPFPSLAQALPLSLAALRDPAALDLRLGYLVPLVCAAALLLCFPLANLRARRPLAWLRESADALARDPARLGAALVACFGALAFRSALGRSDITHILMILAPAALLVVIGLDRLVGAWLAQRERRGLIALRVAALCLIVWAGGLFEKPAPLRSIGYSWSDISTLAQGGYAPRGDRHVQEVWRFVLTRTQPDDPVLFLPDVASYYYLTRRASPIRFVVGHQIVTDAQRAEALATLRAQPPRWIVWDDTLLWVDDIDPRVFLGPDISGWIDAHYVEETRIGKTRILRPRDASAAAAP